MNEHMWKLFVQTGNVEAYLLLKQIEKEDDKYQPNEISNELDELKLE